MKEISWEEITFGRPNMLARTLLLIVPLLASVTEGLHVRPLHSLHVRTLHSLTRASTSEVHPIVMLAKKGGKKGGKSKKGQPKKSGFEWASNFNNKPFETAVLRDLVSTAASGYQAKTGSPLHASLSGSSDVPKAVWNAPIACMITGPAESASEEEPAPEGCCLYANVAALEAHGLGANAYDELIGSRTVLPEDMGGDVKFDSNYGKKLKPAAGDAFTIEGTRWLVEKMCVVDGKLGMERLGGEESGGIRAYDFCPSLSPKLRLPAWHRNCARDALSTALTSPHPAACAVAYMWEDWRLDDGTTCAPGGARRAPEMSEAELEAAVEAQGSAIRQLK